VTEERARPFGPGAALLLLLVTFAANAVVLLVGDSLSDGPVGIVFFAAAAVLGPLVAIYVGLVRHAPDEPTGPALGLVLPRGRAWVLLGLAALIGAALSPLVVYLTEQLLALLPKDTAPDEAAAEWLAALEVPATRVLIAVAEIGLIPFVREALLRGFIQPRLVASSGPLRALSLVVLLDLVTLPFPELFPQTLVAAVPLSLLALAARTTWVPIVGHVALVLGPVGLMALELEPGPALCGGGAALAVVLLALAWRLRVRS
jgi:hypothetical protein